MLVQPLELTKNKADGFALFNLGFRPFFLGAAIFALLSMTVWIGSYILSLPLTIQNLSPMQWHAHEMLYGYGLAVIAGFLLTAVKNWTGVQTLHGKPLLGLFSLWAIARLLMLFGTSFISLAAIFDLLFGLLLIAAIAYPIIITRQWRQLPIVSKLIIIIAGNGLFYCGALGFADQLIPLSIYGALYLIISLIMLVARRVVPFFIERGVGEPVSLRQYRWLDISILMLFIVFFINELLITHAMLTVLTSGLLFLLNGFRLYNWHIRGIWHAPLLWGLYLSLWLINAGFLLLALHYWWSVPPILAVHLFTVGGIALMSLAMMARVSLGHSGRDIRKPSRLVWYALALLLLSALFRSIMPLFAMPQYLWWVGLSYVCWIIAFALFLIVYTPILIKQRLDGQPG